MPLFSGSTKQQVETNPMRRDQVVDWQNRLFRLSHRPFEFFPDQTYAEMDPLQTEALGMREQYARNLGGMVDPSMQAWQSMMSAPDVANNPYVQAMLNQQADIAGRSFREALPGIESAAIGAGQFGGSRQGVVEALQERGIRESLAQSAAQTQMDAYLAGLGQQRYGLSAAPGMAGFGMMPSDILGDVGAQYRAEDQLAIDEAMARHQFAQDEPWMRLERFASPYNLMSRGYGERTTETETTPSGLQIAGQLAGLGMSGFGLYRGLQDANPFGAMGGYSMPSPYGGYGAAGFMPGSSFGFRGGAFG